jgi:hypothetical protein
MDTLDSSVHMFLGTLPASDLYILGNTCMEAVFFFDLDWLSVLFLSSLLFYLSFPGALFFFLVEGLLDRQC